MSMDVYMIATLTTDIEERIYDGKVVNVFTVKSYRGFGDNRVWDYMECVANPLRLVPYDDILEKGLKAKIKGQLESKVRRSKEGKKECSWTCEVEEIIPIEEA